MAYTIQDYSRYFLAKVFGYYQNVWDPSGKSAKPTRMTAQDASSPLGNPLPKVIGLGRFAGQLAIDPDHFGGVKLR